MGASIDHIQRRAEFVRDLASVINRHSRENHSNTPDFLLAEYMVAALEAYEGTVLARADWYGRLDAPGESDAAV